MNIHKLQQAEAAFLQRFPGGFSDPGMAAIKKKHNVDKLTEFTQANLTRVNFNRPGYIAETLLTIVSRSSMVSRFEKPRFRDFIGSLNSHEQQALAEAFEKRLYGRQKQRGFDEFLGMLSPHKLARWAVISVVPFYFAPQKEVFVKPTTAKGILALLEVDEIEYKPTPSWAFYQGYQKLLAEIKNLVAPTLSPNNAALSGFLMSAL
jgi:hypothetical protein